MQERSKHYSNKGGHKERSIINKLLENAVRKGLPLCKSDFSLCPERISNKKSSNQEE
jgi:hypothetical protein